LAAGGRECSDSRTADDRYLAFDRAIDETPGGSTAVAKKAIQDTQHSAGESVLFIDLRRSKAVAQTD